MKRILVVPDLIHGIGLFVPQYTAYVKPQVLAYIVMLDICISCYAHESSFVFVNILLRIDIGKRCCSRLNLDKHDVFLVFGNHVNLDVSESPVALPNRIAMILEILTRSILAQVPYFVMKSHGAYLLRLRTNRFFVSPSAGAAAMSASASSLVMCSTSVDLGMR